MNFKPAILAAIVWAAAFPALAVPGGQSQVGSAQSHGELPKGRAPSDQESQLDRTPVLPSADKLPADFLVTIDRIYVEKVVIEDGSLLSGEEIAAIIAPYQGRRVTVEEIYTLRRELSAAYVKHGYVNSGVVLPDQKISGGTVVMKEVRGTLTSIRVSGTDRLSRSYIVNRIKKHPGEALRIDQLQESLQLLQQDPLIRQIKARLQPGLRPGDSELEIDINRSHPFQIAIGGDNLTSASTGGERGTLSLGDMNLTGRGDRLNIDLGMSGGRGIGSIAYAIPLNARNTTLRAEFGDDRARIIEKPFDQIDIKSRTSRVALFVAHPWILHPNRSLTTFVGIERRHSASTLLGIPFSFSAGDRNGKSSTTVLNAGLEYSARRRNQVLIVRGTVRRGVDLFHPTINAHAPDGTFTAFVGQAEYARRLKPRRSEILFRWTGQVSADPLLALEKMPIGGFNTVRGYRENQLVRDNGQAASVEWRVPLTRLRVGERFYPRNLQVAPFVDFGRSWDLKNGLTNSTAQAIYSSGLGLLWNPIAGLHAEIYWGYAFRDAANPGNNLQDKGVHFRLQHIYSF